MGDICMGDVRVMIVRLSGRPIPMFLLNAHQNLSDGPRVGGVFSVMHAGPFPFGNWSAKGNQRSEGRVFLSYVSPAPLSGNTANRVADDSLQCRPRLFSLREKKFSA